MIEPKFLPIGTVVMLDGGTKRAMIIGYCPVAEGNQMYDYSGCLYPEGVLSSDQTLLFNHEQVSQVFFKGFVDQEQTEFMTKLNQIVAQFGNGQPAAPAAPAGVAPAAPAAPVAPQPAQAPIPPAPVAPEAPAAPVAPAENPNPQA